ncbi:uroporphyrinogen-III synthase [Mangrovimonas futianensis]|uniref:uroporphyrinogen-III synthase n=1 Tax=Mangrovimonas futianensis TaxID=2895523 RepID=UPI001E48C991|nr:uroporphyrinogen-III synthase [Mangrovimonas futianensis]MCF1421002.1 uroporphyrinogen-III synthase [Mangrovimonas futianensis]
MKVLSTKILTQDQKQILKDASIKLIEYSSIQIDFSPFDEDIIADNAIITSQNAAKAVIDKKILIRNCYCVGEKTKSFLEENGQNVNKMKQNASDLAHFISKNLNNEQFWYFCNNLRRDELPSILKAQNIKINEVEVYKTSLNFQKVNEAFDAILFFSPSGIESFTNQNKLKDQAVFCIGNTTAQAAKTFTNNIHTASKPTIEHVLQQVVKYSKQK